MTTPLTPEEKQYLLELARLSLLAAVRHASPPALDPARLTEALRGEGASFVTLTKHGNLRGCIGALEAYQPLAEDVREHAAAAAMEDYRFPQVTARRSSRACHRGLAPHPARPPGLPRLPGSAGQITTGHRRRHPA